MSSTPESTPPSPGCPNVFSIRIVSLDYYMAVPIPGLDFCDSPCFQGRRVEEVPVIRIYGSTLAGQKACLHVHRALPYLYIPCSELEMSKEGQIYINEVSDAVERALQGTYGLKRQHVHGCCLVRAKKFYGYHSAEELFVKIYLYHPTDVARAATLLLGGSVLSRSIQPYESHIPFLLQFMVDCNLYGMSHLHTSQIKFRHPLPDKLIPRAAPNTMHRDFVLEKASSVSASFQAGSCGEAIGNAALWLSSTVPDAWTWTTSDQDILNDKSCVKRQTICELEGDSSIDGILNQSAKIYSSFSQTSHDLKMVQSLIPIWEEELERSGLQEYISSPDISKPPPETVLRSLCDGFQYENGLSDVFTEAKKKLSFKDSLLDGGMMLEQHMKSSADTGGPLILTEDQKLNPLGEEHVHFSEVVSARSSLLESNATPERICEFPGSSSYVGKLNSLTVIRETEKKVSDVETLGLLSWLTSSQAVDGFGSDDELIHETILSPQLLSNSYEKALEKAHLEYETASQQECQDILDSLKGFQFEDQNEASASTGDQDFVVNDPLKVIPQVDGSSDDQNIFPQVDKPSNGDPKRKMETEMTTSSITEKHVSCWPGRKNKRNHLSWGPQPFSTEQKRPTVSCSSNDVSELLHPDERKSSDDARSLSLIDADERCESSDTETEHKLAFMEEERQPIDSVKDELRSNHCNRIDRFEHGKHLLKELTAEIQCNKINRTEEQESKPPGNIKDSMIPSEISHEESCFPKKHRTFVCRESMTFNIACTDSPSDVVQPAELHSSANFYLQDNAPNEDLDPNKSLITRECLDASIGPLEVVDGNVLQMNDASNQVPGLFDTRQLPPAMFNLLSKCSGGGHSSRPGSSGNGVSRIVSFQPDLSEGLSHLKCGSTGNMCAENSQKGMQAKDSNRSRTFALEATSFPVNYNSSTEEYSATEKSLSDVHLKNLGTVKAVSYLKTLEGNEGGCETSGIRACNPRTALVMEDAPVGFVEMTLNRRPPIILKTKDVSEDSEPSTDFIRNIDSTGLPHCETHQFIGFQPFFSDADIEKGVHKYAIGGSYSETIGSIPTNFQNDGSLSYLLTFAICPPSPQSVYQWLLRQTKKNGLCLSMDLSSASDDCPGNVSEYWHGCHHDIPTSMSPEVLDASVCPDSDGFSEKYSDSLKSVANDSQNLNAHSISGNVDVKLENVLDSGAEMSNKSQVEAINMQSKLSAGGYCDISQISGVNEKAKLTPLSQIGFRDPASGGSGQNLTLLSLEIQAESRGSLLPDPQFDAINLISIAIQEDTDYDPKFYVLVRGTDVKSYGRNVDGISGCMLLVFSEERLLFDHLVKVIISYDPDILLGWDVQGSSLGYLAERAAHLGMHLLKSISRTLDIDTKHMAKRSVNHDKEVVDKLASEAGMESIVVDAEIIEDEWGRTHASGIHVGGRIVLNVWRLMRSELKLNLYTVEAVAEEVLRRKVPSIPCTTLNSWFSSGRQRARFRCIEYVLERANLNLQIMNQLDMVNRTSELARVFGIDFFSVLSRGSQFRVESMLLRLLHSQNYLAISPGYQQVASQPAMECLPLVMEPESGFYADPVVVLDFQSLYPSMIIAYNLCYSTCLGKVLPSAGNILGVSSFSPDPRLLLDLKENTLLSPNGVMYVASEVRKGVLPRMLEEILSTRIMVKKAMKKLMPSQQVLQRIMNARQLALKLIANVTYGYTAAGFSGRMPCAELADSIVQCGRKTLEKSISFINSHSKWNARVVYGDTDSMFVLLRGRSREEAFEIGREIALTITSMNPKPVVLKMEKVYHPCFLLTKKRYVGYSYESQGQVKPSFDAKGIETVRRDTCPAVAKTFERSLRLFFERQDVTQVKLYLQRQWARILSGRVSLQDFIFAKEVRLGTYSSAAAASLPPAAIVAAKAMKADPRREPRYGERVPYVVVHGEPGARLVDMVVDPLELLEVNSLYRLNDSYYINKQIIPVLQRAFGLVGADLRRWFLETPRPLRPTAAKRLPLGSSSSASVKPHLRNRIDRYYLSKNCAVCGNLVQRSTFLCDGCSARGPSTAAILIGKTSKLERDLHHLSDICRHCGGGDWIIESGVKCTSLACPVFFERRKVQKELLSLSAVSAEAGFYPKCVSEWF